jgi:membrane protease YdiL (CAAX protease family)
MMGTTETRTRANHVPADVPAARTRVAAFFALAHAISWAIWIPTALASASSASLALALFPLGLFGPAFAAIGLTVFFEGRVGVRRLVGPVLKWRAGVPWYLVVVLGPAAIVWVAAGLSALLGAPTAGFGGSQIPLAIPTYVLFLLLEATGEEIGWRGYALPRLQADHSALTSALTVGVAWAFWHLPLFFIAGLPQTFLPFVPFLVWVVSQSVVFAWVYNGTHGSLLFAIVLHAAINLSIQVFSIMPAQEADPARPFTVLALLGLITAGAVVALTGSRLSAKPRESPASSR